VKSVDEVEGQGSGHHHDDEDDLVEIQGAHEGTDTKGAEGVSRQIAVIGRTPACFVSRSCTTKTTVSASGVIGPPA
jgi:hypothetical protein